MPVFSGRYRSNSENASRPPADAPTPTMGNNPPEIGASTCAAVLRRDLTCLRAELFPEFLLRHKSSTEHGPWLRTVNLLPLCPFGQALGSANAPRKKDSSEL